MKKILISFLLFLPTVLIAQEPKDTILATPDSIIVPEGTLIKAALTRNINGRDLSVGQILDFTLAENILINNVVALPKGLKITGTVTEAKSAKVLGKKGKLAFSIDYLYFSSNNRTIKLRSQIEKNTYGSGLMVAAGAIFLTPFALLIPGQNAKYKAGDVFTAYTDKETTLRKKKKTIETDVTY